MSIPFCKFTVIPFLCWYCIGNKCSTPHYYHPISRPNDSLTLSSVSCNLYTVCADWKAVQIGALIYMQICNKYNLQCWERGLNKPDRAKDGWKETQNSLPGRDATVGSKLSVSAYPQPCCPSQLDGQSLESTCFLNRWEDTLAKVLDWCPYDLLELPEREPSADSCCGPLLGSYRVSLQWTQDKSLAQARN